MTATSHFPDGAKATLALAALIAMVCGLSALVDAGYGDALAFAINLVPLVIIGGLAAYLAILIPIYGAVAAFRSLALSLENR